MGIKSVLSVFAVALIVGASPAGAFVYKQVRDWAVSCSNGLTCTLQYADPENESLLRTIAFERISAPSAPVDVILGFGGAVPIAGSEDGVVELGVADGPAFELPISEAREEADGWQWRFEDVEDAADLLAAMGKGQSMEVSLTLAGEAATLPVSLSGVTAGLILVDETQERIKRTDALYLKGDQPPPEEARVRQITAMDDLPESIRGDFTDPTAPCGGIEPERFAVMDSFLISDEEGEDLIGLPCGLGGAYNQPYVLYSGEGGQFQPLAFPIMTEEGPSTSSMAYNLSYTPVGETITAFFKGRGLGDCGGYDRWTVRDDGLGKVLVLQESRSKGDCDGDYAGGPENWPRSWPPAEE